MQKTLKEIAKLVDGKVIGDADILITGASGIREAVAGEITFLANSKYSSVMDKTAAAAIVTSEDAQTTSKPIIITERRTHNNTRIALFIY